MKKFGQIFGFLAILAIVGLVLSCDEPGAGNITGEWVTLVQIPAGTLTWPEATITLSAFKMGVYVVTQEQWREVMVISPNPSYFSSDPAAGEIQGKRPVEQRSWYDAIEFCNALSIREGLSPYYIINKDSPDPNNNSEYGDNSKWLVTTNGAANGYRLPTEAQWEYACRAGSTTDWHFGDDASELANYAWYNENSGNKTHQVGLKLPNAWGLYDMYGNVSEWCWDWYGDMPTSNQTNYTGTFSGNNRVLRGGHYGISVSDEFIRSSDRSYNNPAFRSISTGFRLVRP